MNTGTPVAKICGITRAADAHMAAAAGARYLGVILAAGSTRSITPARAAVLWRDLRVDRVGVFVNASSGEVASAAEEANLQVLQLHGDEGPEQAAVLRAAGRWTVWKAVRLRGAADFERAVEHYGEAVDGLLLDGWSARARGGTGTSFPWHEVAVARACLPTDVKLIVAGGLDPGNVALATSLLRPDVVDVSSGVESEPGRKDTARVRAFMAAIRARESSIHH